MRLRTSGMLLHISSLPSRHGIGDLGPEAHAFARLLAANGQVLWQMLPLNPTSPAIGNSPYSSPSAFAGNTLFISPELLLEEGFVTQADIDEADERSASLHSHGGNGTGIDYERVELQRAFLLRAAYERNRDALETDASFRSFVEANAFWLEDYARFQTIKEAYGGASWPAWPEPLARREAPALAAWDRGETIPLRQARFAQYLFYRQWGRLRALCARLGVRLVGDVPIYVTHDSCDVWAHRSFFRLDEAGMPAFVAGVPPDYFSPTGQRWGNPLYNWDALARNGYSWWVERLEHNFRLFDCVRLDHFRGFAGFWEIPASQTTAVNGVWRDGPGHALFRTLARRLLSLPIIAEDLGVITPDVRELQRDLGFPGMAVLQFGFGGDLAENPHAPFMHRVNQAVYTGTHDNAPTLGWFLENAAWEERHTLGAYAGYEITEDNVTRTLVRMALGSVADMAVVPVQDVLGLGMEARMNTPSTVKGNWSWRLAPGQIDTESMNWFAQKTALYGRHAGNRK